MTKLLAVLMFLASSAQASPYFRPLDPHHIQTDELAVFSPFNSAPAIGVMDIALLTHSTKDGSLVPARLRNWIAPESWVPLAIGGGGSIKGDAVIHIGMSTNLLPQVATLALGGFDKFSSPLMVAVKNALTDGLALPGGSTVGFSFGIGLSGQAVKGGVFQSFNEMFPGNGLGDTLKNATRLSVGATWAL